MTGLLVLDSDIVFKIQFIFPSFALFNLKRGPFCKPLSDVGLLMKDYYIKIIIIPSGTRIFFRVRCYLYLIIIIIIIIIINPLLTKLVRSRWPDIGHLD